MQGGRWHLFPVSCLVTMSQQERRCLPMTIFEALVLMISFATLIVIVIREK
ncbi:putative holin-like toxin [Margalitia sp. FSL K6-0131]|uniref:putative holin-like toxin n=1 Tax=Margalitia sp. FSL K6-0131 TaxID=2954604 RepID=UPI00404704AA